MTDQEAKQKAESIVKEWDAKYKRVAKTTTIIEFDQKTSDIVGLIAEHVTKYPEGTYEMAWIEQPDIDEDEETYELIEKHIYQLTETMEWVVGGDIDNARKALLLHPTKNAG